MIEGTVQEIEGVRFIKLRVLEPDRFVHGVGVHAVSLRLLQEAPGLRNDLKRLGLRRVGTNYKYGYAHALYAQDTRNKGDLP